MASVVYFGSRDEVGSSSYDYVWDNTCNFVYAGLCYKEIQSRSGEYLVLLFPLLIDPSVIMHCIVFKNFPQPASLPPSVNPQVHQ